MTSTPAQSRTRVLAHATYRYAAWIALLAAAILSYAIALPAPSAQAAPVPLGEQAAAYARNHLLNKPYDGSGRTTIAFNCSGSTYLAWSSVAPGHVNPGPSRDQYNGAGDRLYVGRGNSINGNGLLPGDLLFWSTTGAQSCRRRPVSTPGLAM
jgi:cell wall-associated NlpC family hydrolase